MKNLTTKLANLATATDIALGTLRNQVVHYTNGGGLYNDVRALRDLTAKPEVQATIAAGVVIGSTIGGFVGAMKIASSICDKHGYDADNQVEPGMEGYNTISGLVFTSAAALTALPLTASAAYAYAFDRAITAQ